MIDLKNPSYILVNENNKIFTNLNEYDLKLKRFKGEYSLLHNTYSNDSFFLHHFLLKNSGQPLLVLNSANDKYTEITNCYNRFLENDIPKYIEEKIEKEKEHHKDIEMDKNLGQLQIALVKQMVEKEIEAVRNKNGKDLMEHSFINGQLIGLQWVSQMIENIVERKNF